MPSMMDRDAVRTQMDALPTEELVDILARRDEEEWLPEVFDIVTDVLRRREVAIEPAVEAARAAFPPEPDPDALVDLVTVAHFFTPVEARLCYEHLRRAGLSAVIADENVAAINYPLGVLGGGIRVQVPRAQEADAQELMQQRGAVELPEECPSCGSTEVTRIDGAPPAGECRQCHHRW